MGYIEQEVEIVGSRKTKKIKALFDTGALSNYIRAVLDDGETPDDIGFPIFEGEKGIICANGSISPGSIIRFTEIRIKHVAFGQPRFVMTPILTWEAIIGAELMQTLRITLDPRKERIVVPNQ